MRAAVYEAFRGPLTIRSEPDPTPADGGVVIEVKATGLCLSDWHGWMGHDPDITLPHVPGHELAGTVAAVGKAVTRWQVGDRVTLPFVCGCGSCPQCRSGNHQVCDRQFQPGFTHWGSFAQYVAADYADVNLVRLPDELDFITAASLGCRFATSFRAVVAQGRVTAGQWVAVHGCGGVGLSAIMIARVLGANTVAVDIKADRLQFARSIGAVAAIDASAVEDVPASIIDITGGGAHVSIDALGHPAVSYHSVACLRKRGKHIQVGLMPPEHHNTAVPMDRIVARELEILGSHGMQAERYGDMLEMIRTGRLHPERLIGRTIDLEAACDDLTQMDGFTGIGVSVIDRF